MTPLFSMREALEDPNLLGAELCGPTWLGWRALLIATMGERLTPEETQMYRRLTGRLQTPLKRVREFWAVVGRRGGKSRATAALAVYIAALCNHPNLAQGETGVVLLIAPDQRQAKILLDYIEGFLEASPILQQLIDRRIADALQLTNRVVVEVRAASFRRLRGLTALAVVADECAFWLADDSSNPDREIIQSVRPMLATTKGMLIGVSSPYGRSGVLYDTYRAHYGDAGDPETLVAQAETRVLNEMVPQDFVEREYANDPIGAAAEYGAQFRTDIAALLTSEAVRACIDGKRERLPELRHYYVGFCDPSGGSNDSMTLAISHREGKTSVLDAVREAVPPFSPEAVVEEFAALLRKYQITRIEGDRYAGEWPIEQFIKRGIVYDHASRDRSAIYMDVVPLINAGLVSLLEHTKLERQLLGLERRVSRAGRDLVDHGRGAHDDLANAACGALLAAQEQGAVQPMHRLPSHGIDTHDPLATAEENAIAMARAEQRSGFFSGPGWAPTWHGDESLPVRAIN